MQKTAKEYKNAKTATIVKHRQITKMQKQYKYSNITERHCNVQQKIQKTPKIKIAAVALRWRLVPCGGAAVVLRCRAAAPVFAQKHVNWQYVTKIRIFSGSSQK